MGEQHIAINLFRYIYAIRTQRMHIIKQIGTRF